MKSNLNPLYVVTESKHGKVWKAVFGKGELQKLKGARKIANAMNSDHPLLVDTTRKIRTSEILKGPVKRSVSWYGDPRGTQTGLHTLAMKANPTKSQLRKIGKGSGANPWSVINQAKTYAGD